MKFRFCGDLECPDWVLAEIYTLSKMSSVKMRMLCQLVATAVTDDQLDEEKARKIVVDAKIDTEAYTMEACVSVIYTILTSAARYNVEPDVLSNELEQLGLPKEHANALCKIYTQRMMAIRTALSNHVLRVSSVSDVSCDIPRPGAKSAVLSFRQEDKIKSASTKHSIQLTGQQLALLISELKSAKKVMDSTENE